MALTTLVIGILFIIGVVFLIGLLAKLTKAFVSAVVLSFITVALIFGLVGILSYAGYVDLNKVPGSSFLVGQKDKITAFATKAADVKDKASDIAENIKQINLTAGGQ